MKTLTARLRKIANLSEFARQSGIPRRTLDRIKGGNHAPATTTRLALEAALATFEARK